MIELNMFVYEGVGLGHPCLDIDECANHHGGCSALTNCTNTNVLCCFLMSLTMEFDRARSPVVHARMDISEMDSIALVGPCPSPFCLVLAFIDMLNSVSHAWSGFFLAQVISELILHRNQSVLCVLLIRYRRVPEDERQLRH